MNFYAISLTGLFAGGVSCAAVQGGLLAALVMRQRQPAPAGAVQPLGRADDAPPVSTTADGIQQVIVTAVTGAYQPELLEIAAGVPTRLIVRSRDAEGCVRAFVIVSRDLQRILPVNGDTVIELGRLEPGRLTYSCGMGMYTGRFTVKAPKEPAGAARRVAAGERP